MDVGDIVEGKYEIVRLIGHGGMGSVFEAVHTRIARRVALKVLKPEFQSSPDVVKRFVMEAQAAAAIGSDHIIDVTDGGEDANGAPYLVMEYLEGEDLAAVLEREGALACDRAARLVSQACDALNAAHDKGIIHRDLKPANLFVTPRSDGSERVKVLDFGVAKFLDMSMTRTQAVIGTLYYMSPEQAESSKKVDARSDVFSLGVILYEALAGRKPFDADSMRELLVQIMVGQPPPLDTLRPDLPPGLVAVARRAMEPDASHRFGSMAEFTQALAPFVEKPTVAHGAAAPLPPTLHAARDSAAFAATMQDAPPVAQAATAAPIASAPRMATPAPGAPMAAQPLPRGASPLIYVAAGLGAFVLVGAGVFGGIVLQRRSSPDSSEPSRVSVGPSEGRDIGAPEQTLPTSAMGPPATEATTVASTPPPPSKEATPPPGEATSPTVATKPAPAPAPRDSSPPGAPTESPPPAPSGPRTLSKAEILGGFRSAKTRACVGSQSWPGHDISVRATIQPSGKASSVTVTGGGEAWGDESEIRDCFRRKILAARWPSFSGPPIDASHRYIGMLRFYRQCGKTRCGVPMDSRGEPTRSITESEKACTSGCIDRYPPY